MVTIEAIPGAALRLGYAGEHLARRIMFPTSGLCGLYGCGTATIVATRADDEESYLVAAEEGIGCVYWNLRRVDVARPGAGECELRWTVGGEVVHKEVWITEVEESLDPPEEWPEPGEAPEDPAHGYLETVAAAGASAREAAKRAQGYANNAAASAGEAAKSASAVVDMQVSVEELPAGEPAAVAKEMADGVVKLKFGIPAGLPGYTPVKGKDYFDGKDGYTPVKGKDYFDGKDGYTPVKGKDYFDGKDGYTPVKGKDYTDGKTPVRGEDYWTLADQRAVVDAVLAALPVYNGEVESV